MKIYLQVSEIVKLVKKLEKIEIPLDKYPELEGMNSEEIAEYIDENSYDMDSTNGLHESLGEQIEYTDVKSEIEKHVENIYKIVKK